MCRYIDPVTRASHLHSNDFSEPDRPAGDFNESRSTAGAHDSGCGVFAAGPAAGEAAVRCAMVPGTTEFSTPTYKVGAYHG